MRDQLVLGERLRFEWVWEGPSPTDFEVAFGCESEAELRELIAMCGEREFWRQFKSASSPNLLWAEARTEGDRRVRVWVHLHGADFAPPEPAPAPLLERLRQEALQAVEEPPREFGIRRVRDQGGEIVHAEGPGVRDAS